MTERSAVIGRLGRPRHRASSLRVHDGAEAAHSAAVCEEAA